MTNLRSLANESMGWLTGTGILPILAGGIAIYASFTAVWPQARRPFSTE